MIVLVSSWLVVGWIVLRQHVRGLKSLFGICSNLYHLLLATQTSSQATNNCPQLDASTTTMAGERMTAAVPKQQSRWKEFMTRRVGRAVLEIAAKTKNVLVVVGSLSNPCVLFVCLAG